MKFIWEPTDVRGGRTVGRPGRRERWMIVYTPGLPANSYGLASLEDGLLAVHSLTREQLTEHLNISAEVPAQYLPFPEPIKP